MTRGPGGNSPANIQQYLGGVKYPATKEDLIDQAKKNDAPIAVMETIERFQPDEYRGPQEVMKAYGQPG